MPIFPFGLAGIKKQFIAVKVSSRWKIEFWISCFRLRHIWQQNSCHFKRERQRKEEHLYCTFQRFEELFLLSRLTDLPSLKGSNVWIISWKMLFLIKLLCREAELPPLCSRGLACERRNRLWFKHSADWDGALQYRPSNWFLILSRSEILPSI